MLRNKNKIVIAALTLCILSGCSAKEKTLPTSFDTETISMYFAEDTSKEILNQYASVPGYEYLWELFLDNFRITDNKEGVITFSIIDAKNLRETLSVQDLEQLKSSGENKEDLLIQVLSAKTDLPLVTKTAEIELVDDMYSTNSFIMEQFTAFMSALSNDLLSNVDNVLRSHKLLSDVNLKTVPTGKSIVFNYSTPEDIKICTTLDEIMTGEEALNKLREKNILNDFVCNDKGMPVYVRYTLINLGTEVIKTPKLLKNVNSSYLVCEVTQTPLGLIFPENCEPLKETLCEEFFLLDDKESEIYLIDGTKVLGKVEIGGKNNEE